MAEPVIEQLLAKAAAEYESLRLLEQRAVAAGLELAFLPKANERRAFALLGSHNHAQNQAKLAPLLPAFNRKGLTDPRKPPSPAETRYLITVAPFLDAISDVEERIRLRLSANAPQDLALLRCPNNVRAAWGQVVRVPVICSPNVEWILLDPDPVFDQRPVLRQPDSGQPVWIEFPGDDGVITIAALSRTGGFVCHRLNVEVNP